MAAYKKTDYGALRAERVGSRRWRLIEDWHTPFGVVPAGFESDGVSSGPFRAFASPGGSFFEAAIIHDYLYVHAVNSKAYADKAFYQTALVFGVFKIRALVALQLVSLFGRGNYA